MVSECTPFAQSKVTGRNSATIRSPAELGYFEQKCTSLANTLKIENSTITTLEFVQAGTTLQFPNGDPTCGRPSQAVSVNLCRVALNISTSSRSSITMEAWLPENWSGRFLSTGNGGLGGCIQYEDIQYAVSLGFATVGTNNGHNGMTGVSFLNNPDIIEDFAYRALHTGVIVGKEISACFYGAQQTKSYYLGCSTGGRQGFKEAQAFPEDFDGIVAGAPAFSFNNLTSWSCHFLPLLGPVGSPTFIPFDMWPTIHEDMLKQCDGLDGLVDGILESPDLCNYNPDGLRCSSDQANNTNCLTPTQLQTLRSIYLPLLDADGSLVYPRLQPGAETTEAPSTYFTGQAFGAADWWRYAIFNDTNWDPTTLKPADYALASSLNLFNIETWDGDLSGFKNKGGKLLHYHGLVDGVISSDNSPRYYEHVSQTMRLDSAALDDFYRFFRISGMSHCGGGPGATHIGNVAWNVASMDPEENVLMAIVRWVEEGIAPDTVTGTAYVNGNQSAGVAFKRKHCRWPSRNEYQAGDPNEATSWKCV
ncbi:Tannase/feruloyl esterase [Rhexocercosporidium sp. MPI-PUGE-AT-0058]|nr:Tannase/feruloyl esterase [Rhexocercosporidium sp. MPI-PUGE-AT-0058]